MSDRDDPIDRAPTTTLRSDALDGLLEAHATLQARVHELEVDRDLWRERAEEALRLQDLFETWSMRWKAGARHLRADRAAEREFSYQQTQLLERASLGLVQERSDLNHTRAALARITEQRDRLREALECAGRDFVAGHIHMAERCDETDISWLMDHLEESFGRICDAQAADSAGDTREGE